MTEPTKAAEPITVRPVHGDVWATRRRGRKFSVMHVCGHHEPPWVTGYWWSGDSLDPCRHGSIELPHFLRHFTLIEREL